MNTALIRHNVHISTAQNKILRVPIHSVTELSGELLHARNRISILVSLVALFALSTGVFALLWVAK